MPDLILSGLDWSVSAPEDGAGVSIFASVFNDGTDVSSSFGLDLLVDGVVAGSRVVSGLLGGASATLRAEWVASPGTHEISAVADPANAVREANETNNLRLGGLDIPYPDLVMTNVSWYPVDYRSGDIVTVVVTVHNAGAGGTSREIVLESSVDQYPLSNRIIGGLGAKDTSQASLQWTAAPGEHTLFLRLDPARSVRESDRSNNRLAVRLGKAYPDLVVSNLSVSPGNPSDGSPAVLSAVVRNDGPGNTTASFAVTFLVDGNPAGTRNLPGLSSNAGRTVSVEWLPTPGRHVLRAEADPDGRLAESVETNNFRLLELSVPYPDLEVLGIDWEQSLPTDGRQVGFNASVSNTGPGNTSRVVQVRLLVDGQEADTGVLRGLPAGARANLTLNWTASAGKHEVRVEADPGGLVGESDETDGFLVREIDVPYPDLVVSNLSLFPPAPECGEPVTVSASLVNSGAGNTSSPFWVHFYANGDKVRSVYVSGLVRGALQTLDAQWSAVPGTSDLAVVVDEAGEVPESGELNNRALTRVSVPFPDLSAVITSWSPAAARAGERLNVTVELRNGGANTSLPFELGLYENGALVRTARMSGMLAGEVAVLNLSLVLGSDRPEIRAVADYAGAVPELSEADNTHTISYPGGAVLPPPVAYDAVFREVRYFPEEPVDGEPVTVLATVGSAATGNLPVLEMDVSCLLDGVSSQSRRVRLVGGEGVASFELGPPPGDHTVGLSIGPAGQAPESRRDNNQASASFSTLPPDISVESLSTGAAQATDGNPVSVSCIVRNLGPGSTRNELSVALLQDGLPVASRTVSGLLAGANSTLLFELQSSPGNHRLRAEVAGQGRLLQTDLSNDRAFSAFRVAAPELAVASVSAPARADAGSTVSIAVTVSNSGASTVRESYVRVLVDGIRLGDSPLSGLFPGRPVTVIRQWTAAPGPHSIMAIADATGAMGETDETDNVLTVPSTDVPLPDLVLGNLSLVQQPLDGAAGLATVEVRNAGDAAMGPVKVGFFVDEAQTGTFPLGGVPAGASFTVSLGFPVPAGPHLLWARAVPAGQAVELDETNNLATLQVAGTGFPDLELSGLAVPPTAVDGASVPLFAEVQNNGGSTAQRFSLSFFVDGARVGDQQLEGIPAGGRASASVLWTASPGTHRVRAVVDLDDVVTELNETNNQATREGLSTEQPDIMVEDLSAVRVSDPRVPDQCRIFVTLENIGGPTLRGFSAAVYLDDRPVGTVFARGLLARNTTQLSLLAPAGTAARVSVVVDGEGVLAEGDESNNMAAEPFAPVPGIEGALPDLSVGGLWMEPATPSDGDGVRVFAAITNDGTAPLLGRVEARLSHGGSNRSTTLDALAAGGRALVAFDTVASGGAMAMELSVDPLRAVPESRRDNNIACATFTVPLPDLVVAGLERWNTTEGLRAPLFVVLENNGTGDTSRKISTALYVAGQQHSQLSFRGLPAGGRHCLAVDWLPVSGEIDVVAWADPGEEVAGPPDGPDRLHEPIATSYPDLFIYNITWSPHLRQEDRTDLFVEVGNGGGATARPISVTLSVDAEVLGALELPAMAAGSRTVLSWSWAVRPGNHSFSAAVDQNDAVLESDEANNRAARAFPSGEFSAPPSRANLALSGLGYHQYRLPSVTDNGSGAQANVYRLNFTVMNDGENGTMFCHALLLADGLKAGEVVVPPLPANTSVNLTFDWLAPAGDYRYKVVLDDRRALAESFETDNDDSLRIAPNNAPKAIPGGPYKVRHGEPLTMKGVGQDPDGFIALYEWDLDGDGVFGGGNDTVSTTTGTVTKIYRTARLYKVSLRVIDDSGATAVETTTVLVEEKPPRPGLSINQYTVIGLAVLVAICITFITMLIRGKGEIFRKEGQ